MKRVESILYRILQNICKHKDKQILAFRKTEVGNIPYMTVSYKYNVLTKWKCRKCHKNWLEETTE